MRILKRSLLLLTLLAVSSCGFKLRGEANKSLQGQTVWIVAKDNFHPLVVDLNRRLKRQGAAVFTETESEKVIERQNSGIVAFLGIVREQRKILSVDSTGRALEYEFSVEMDVVIQAASSIKEEIENKDRKASTLSVRRVLVYDNNQLLAKSRERDKVREEMYLVIVGQLLERLRAQSL